MTCELQWPVWTLFDSKVHASDVTGYVKGNGLKCANGYPKRMFSFMLSCVVLFIDSEGGFWKIEVTATVFTSVS